MKTLFVLASAFCLTANAAAPTIDKPVPAVDQNDATKGTIMFTLHGMNGKESIHWSRRWIADGINTAPDNPWQVARDGSLFFSGVNNTADDVPIVLLLDTNKKHGMTFKELLHSHPIAGKIRPFPSNCGRK